MRSHRFLLALPLAIAAGCGSSSSSPSSNTSLPPGFYIRISNLTFTPLDLAVPPGATVTVINDDPMPHSVTSESTSGTYTPGAVSGISFDTAPFTGSATFTIPQNAADGTVIPYFCTVHRGSMNTPNGTLTVSASAQPGPAPAGTGGAPMGGGGGY